MHLATVERASSDSMEELDYNFVPGAFDVICARGKEAYQHRGNKSFRATLEHHLPAYANANNKLEKSEIVSAIFHAIKEATPEGGFIRKNEKGQWCRVAVHIAREKIGQGFRDLLFTEYRSSTKAKILRRRERLYPSDASPQKISEGKEAPKTKAIGPTADSAMPPLKCPSFDIQPLPLSSSSTAQGDMAILRQCSFSFVKDSASLNSGNQEIESTFVPELTTSQTVPAGTTDVATRTQYYHAVVPARAMYSYRVGEVPLGQAYPSNGTSPTWSYPHHHQYPRQDDRSSNFFHHVRAHSWSDHYRLPGADNHEYRYSNRGHAHSWGE